LVEVFLAPRWAGYFCVLRLPYRPEVVRHPVHPDLIDSSACRSPRRNGAGPIL
jgi:hypothetical protein